MSFVRGSRYVDGVKRSRRHEDSSRRPPILSSSVAAGVGDEVGADDDETLDVEDGLLDSEELPAPTPGPKRIPSAIINNTNAASRVQNKLRFKPQSLRRVLF